VLLCFSSLPVSLLIPVLRGLSQYKQDHSHSIRTSGGVPLPLSGNNEGVTPILGLAAIAIRSLRGLTRLDWIRLD